MTGFLILLILFLTGAMFGTALTASIVVHPILTTVKRATAIEVFKPFFHKTHNVVLSLSIAISIIALIVSIMTGNWWWFIVSLLMHLNGPYTIFMMMPLNRRLMADDVDPESSETAADLKKWGSLHLVRTLMNGTIFLLFIGLAI